MHFLCEDCEAFFESAGDYRAHRARTHEMARGAA